MNAVAKWSSSLILFKENSSLASTGGSIERSVVNGSSGKQMHGLSSILRLR
jgi:hypothetical protein